MVSQVFKIVFVLSKENVAMPVDVDNFMMRDITANSITVFSGSEFGYADADKVTVKQNMGQPGEWIAVDADVNCNGSLLANGNPIFVTNAADFGGKGNFDFDIDEFPCS